MERIVLLSIAVFLFASITKAQITKGSVLLGGGIGFTSQKSEFPTSASDKRKSFSLTPTVGVAFKQNLVSGIFLRYTNTKDEPSPSGGQYYRSNSYGGGLFVRKYIPFAKSFYFFGEPDLYYFASTSKTSASSTKNKSWNVGLGFAPGLAYALNKKIHLEAGLPGLLSLDYGQSEFNDPSYQISKQKGFAFGANASSLSSLAFGFRFFFAK
jgi:hypothetical protein